MMRNLKVLVLFVMMCNVTITKSFKLRKRPVKHYDSVERNHYKATTNTQKNNIEDTIESILDEKLARNHFAIEKIIQQNSRLLDEIKYLEKREIQLEEEMQQLKLSKMISVLIQPRELHRDTTHNPTRRRSAVKRYRRRHRRHEDSVLPRWDIYRSIIEEPC